jgi:hypothetical protein
MRPLDDDLGRHVAGVGQPVHRVGIEARQHRRCAEGQRRGRAGRDVTGFGAGQRRDLRTGHLLEVADPNECPGGLRHGVDDQRVHQRPASQRGIATGVDHRPDAETRVDRHAALVSR